MIKSLKVNFESKNFDDFRFSHRLVILSGKSDMVDGILGICERGLLSDMSPYIPFDGIKTIGKPVEFRLSGDKGSVEYKNNNLVGDLTPDDCATVVRYAGGDSIRVGQEQTYEAGYDVTIGKSFIANRRYTILGSRGYLRLPVVMELVTDGEFTINESSGRMTVCYKAASSKPVPSWVNVVFLLLQEVHIMDYKSTLLLSCMDKILPDRVLRLLLLQLLKRVEVEQVFWHTNKESLAVAFDGSCRIFVV